MADHVLVIGNRNYSSWSLRAWLALRHAGIAFETRLVPLDTPHTLSEIRRYSGAARVPVLLVGRDPIWDSLAICEYAAEFGGRGWPADPLARATARAMTSEMHAGFAALRRTWPMNIRASGRRVKAPAEALADLGRIEELWLDCRARFGSGGPWLFGGYSIADAFYAPVACRLATYAPRALAPVAADYLATALGEAHLAQWSAAARAETARIEHEEVGLT